MDNFQINDNYYLYKFYRNVRYDQLPEMYNYYYIDQTYNTFDYPSQPAITDFSPRPAGRRNTQNKIQQVREKINDVISMANVDQKEGKT